MHTLPNVFKFFRMHETLKNTDTIRRIHEIRDEFPILREMVNGEPLVYLDSAATAQKPEVVISSIANYYRQSNSNVHRGVHSLSQTATALYEDARTTVKEFINARYAEEIIFTKGTTDSINLLAHGLGKILIDQGDEILTTEMEHHSNFVPWQALALEKKATLKIIRFDDKGEIKPSDVESMISEKTRLLAITHASNTLGSINDIKEIVNICHAKNILVVVDGAQYIPHAQIDVQDLNCDFYVFSAHKLFGPTGTGVLYGNRKLLNQLPPYQTGGGMISEVGLQSTEYASSPQVFEAGTPNIAGVVGMAVAIKYLQETGYAFIEAHEKNLLRLATEKLLQIPGLKIIGTSENKVPLISFVVKGLHPFDIGSLLDQMGIAVRTGHHCTQPIMTRYGISGTVRASFAFYNTADEVERLYQGILKALKILS